MFREFFSISEDGDFTAFPGNLCQCLTTLTVKTCVFAVTQSLLCFSLYPSPPVLSLGANEKSLFPSSLHPPFRCLCTLMNPERSLSLVNSPSSLTGQMLQSLNHLGGLLLNSLQYVHISQAQWSPELGSVLQAWPQKKLSRRDGYFITGTR